MTPAAELRMTVEVDTGRWRETVLDSVCLVVPQARVTAFAAERTARAQLRERQQYRGRSVEDARKAAVCPMETLDFYPHQQSGGPRSRRLCCPNRSWPGLRDGRTIAAGSPAEIRALADPCAQGFFP